MQSHERLVVLFLCLLLYPQMIGIWDVLSAVCTVKFVKITSA